MVISILFFILISLIFILLYNIKKMKNDYYVINNKYKLINKRYDILSNVVIQALHLMKQDTSVDTIKDLFSKLNTKLDNLNLDNLDK